MALVGFVKTSKANLHLISSPENKVIFTTDSHELFVGANQISALSYLDTEAHRTSLVNPPEKLYYVKATDKLWRFSTTWKCLNPDSIAAGIQVADTGSHFVSTDLEGVLDELGSTYIFEKLVSSKTWVINHSLNKYPVVTTVDPEGLMIVGDVFYSSLNSLVIEFSSLRTGKAYLN